MRRHKENLVLSRCDLRIEAQYYQYYVEKALSRLSETERRAIHLRFLKPRTIAQVATQMKISWEEADLLIDHAIEKMRECFREFLRCQPPDTAA